MRMISVKLEFIKGHPVLNISNAFLSEVFFMAGSSDTEPEVYSWLSSEKLWWDIG